MVYQQVIVDGALVFVAIFAISALACLYEAGKQGLSRWRWFLRGLFFGPFALLSAEISPPAKVSAGVRPKRFTAPPPSSVVVFADRRQVERRQRQLPGYGDNLPDRRMSQRQRRDEPPKFSSPAYGN